MRRWLVLLLTLALAAACGGDDGGDGGGDGGGDLEGGQSVVAGDAEEGIEGVMAIRVYYSVPVHTESIVDYSLRPPAGGIHNPVWWNCGFYDEPIPDEHAVHDLEHGVVWLAYSPDLDPAEIEVIHDLARNDDRVLAAPYPDLAADEAVVATAWARQLRLDAVDDPRLAEFVAQYQDGSQAPEAGASCSGTPFGEPIP
jgi:hypothetical protein